MTRNPLRRAGAIPKIVRIAPPLTVTVEELENGLDLLEESL